MKSFATGLAAIAITASAQSYYGMPQQSYGTPQQSYGMFQQSYGGYPSQNMGGQPAANPYAAFFPSATPAAPGTQQWYSPTQQYSPPYKKFVPAILDAPVFGVANFTDLDFKVEFAQVSGSKTAVKIDIGAGAIGSEVTIGFRIGTLGVCSETLEFDEFNPMKEIDAYGKANPYQDPKTGRIPDIKSFTDGSFE